MGSPPPTLLTGLMLTGALFACGEASAAPHDAATLVVYVDNYARIPPDILVRAQDEAARIYARAGVRISWVDGENGTIRSDLTAAEPLRVLLLCQVMSERKITLDQIPAGVLARAGRGAGRAYIFSARVIEAAVRQRSDPAIALGRVLAHEVGHLVLPREGHSEKAS
jgi:hypothetical protein